MKTPERIGGITVTSPILLGGGVVKSPFSPELSDYFDTDSVGAITIGSITPEERVGNTGILNWPEQHGQYEIYAKEGGLHANGMRNLGIIKTMDAIPKGASKPILLSVAGYSTDDYVSAIKAILAHKNAALISAIEVNCSCPTMGRAPMAYSIETLAHLVSELRKLDLKVPLWFKLSPYLTTVEVADLAKQHPEYAFNACPTVPDTYISEVANLIKANSDIIAAVIVSNGLPQVSRKTAIEIQKPDGNVSHLAGLSGSALKKGNLKTIRFLRAQDVRVDIIGCGGVLTIQDVSDYLTAGASAVQCSGGPFWGNGASFFENFRIQTKTSAG